jgi:hypothetical protein
VSECGKELTYVTCYAFGNKERSRPAVSELDPARLRGMNRPHLSHRATPDDLTFHFLIPRSGTQQTEVLPAQSDSAIALYRLNECPPCQRGDG